MKELKKKLANDSTKMNILRNSTYNILQNENHLPRILSDNVEFSDILQGLSVLLVMKQAQ